MSYSLYLDDIREPKARFDVIVRSYEEFVNHILKYGIPTYISFDHDLGIDCNGKIAKSGYDAAKWLIGSSLDGILAFPNNFTFNVHSANPVGRVNIEGILNNYLVFSMCIENKKQELSVENITIESML